MITGCPAQSVDLQLFDKDGNMIVTMMDDNALFGSYPVEDSMRIHVSLYKSNCGGMGGLVVRALIFHH